MPFYWEVNEMVNMLVFLVGVIVILKRGKFFLHMLQIEGYKNKQFIKWMNSSSRVYPRKVRVSVSVLTFFTAVYIFLSIFLKNNYLLYGYLVIWIIFMDYSVQWKEEEVKKELVFTKRAMRLYVSLIFVDLIEIGIILAVFFMTVNNRQYYFPIILFAETLIYYFQPLNIILGNMIVEPIEIKINRHFYLKAQAKIKSLKNLTSIGITGSFGKTSTKFIVATILEKKFKTLNTPESYNTAMGISKVINNDLNEDYEIFVAEMGARNIGDIKELTELVHPKIGIITSIGETHLETFLNLENIMKTKYELIEGLPADGVAIFNYDNEYVRKLADKTFKEKLLYGLGDSEKLDLYATDIEISELGSSFNINDKDGNKIRCTTKLLGKHNIYNILAGVAVGRVLGLSFEEIRDRIEEIQPVPHRLNIITPSTGIIIIDDAFNSNPIGAKAALDVISQFKEGKKIIVTPGMVELGEREEAANKEFGTQIGKVCDYVILVGEKRTEPIYRGLMEFGYTKENIFVVNDLNEATDQIQKIVKPKDIVLFENDLPDNYNE